MNTKRLWLGVSGMSLLWVASVHAVVTEVIWLGGDGTWSTAAKWSTGVAPNNNALTNYVVRIDDNNGAASTVTQTTASISVTIDKLVLDADDRLHLNNGVDFCVTNGPAGGVITNRGSISLNATSTSGTDLIVAGGPVTLTAGGLVVLGNYVNNRLRAVAATDVLVNEDNTIEGAGQIGSGSMGLDNRGTITANQPTELVVDPSVAGAVNSGLLEAANGGLLRLYDGIFSNALGTIRALNTSTVEVDQATIVGGLLTTEGTGAIRSDVGLRSTLVDVRNTGRVLLPNGADFVLVGTITNACARLVRYGGALTYAALDLPDGLDADGDGLPNGWERDNSLDPFDDTGANGADGDPDGDGSPNTEELAAGTHPLDNDSVLRVVAVVPEGSDIRITWSCVTNHSYQVQTNATPAAAGYADLGSVIVVPAGFGDPTTNHLHTGGALWTNLFCRVRVVP